MPTDSEARRAATLERMRDALEASRCALELLLTTPLDRYQWEIVWAAIRSLQNAECGMTRNVECGMRNAE